MNLKSPINGTKTLLCGVAGSGKTYSLPTIIESGLELAVIITDPGGDETLLDSMQDRKLPLDKLFYKYIPLAAPSWSSLIEIGKRINTMGYKDLSEMKYGIEKSSYQQFLVLLKTLENFIDDRTGKELGSVSLWNSSRCLAIDSITGVNIMALDLLVGGKPAPHQGEWGVSMNIEERLINKLCADTKCFFIAIAHLEPELDEVSGRRDLMPAFLGRKLAPKMPRIFSDVIMAFREGDKFFWSTTASNVALKARNLPLRDKLEPTFGQIITTWQSRLKETEHVEEEKDNTVG